MTTGPSGQEQNHGRHELARRGRCPECDDEYERLAGHWKGPCGPLALDRRQRTLIAGFLLGDDHVGGNGENRHFQLSTRWRPFARWVFAELAWLAASVVRIEDGREERCPPAQRYVVRTHAHPGLSRFRGWYHPSENGGDAATSNSLDTKPTACPRRSPRQRAHVPSRASVARHRRITGVVSPEVRDDTTSIIFSRG